jgi:hypothetical protein
LLNKYQWGLYAQSAGEETIKIFDDFIKKSQWKPFVERLVDCHKEICPDKSSSEEFRESITEACKALQTGEFEEDELSYEETASEIDDILEESWSFLLQECNGKAKDVMCYDMVYSSICLSYSYPSCFIPYGYYGLFNVLTEICGEFDIALPTVPPQRDFKNRFLYYGEICKAFQAFRLANQLTIAELWAFIYQYANKVIGLQQWISTLSAPPRRAFFIGGNKNNNGDLEDINNNVDDKNFIRRWQGSPDAERNDVHVMYCLAPVSAVN